MGLDITGFTSELTYHAGYGGLHRIRTMAVMIARDMSYQDAWQLLMGPQNRLDPLWNESYRKWLEREELMDYHQLLHFSDSEGILIKEWYLQKTKYEWSMHLGSLDKLYEELEAIRMTITSDPVKYGMDELPMPTFWQLYNLVKDEYENGYAVVFH